MILGIGVDVVQISRMKVLIGRWGRKFIQRVFTQDEIDYCEDRGDSVPHYAVRFAAKEAVLKALSEQNMDRYSLRDIEVLRSTRGKPGIRLHGKVCETAQNRGVQRILVSLTHSADIAAAQVVLEGEARTEVN